jgi:hypothetical protein
MNTDTMMTESQNLLRELEQIDNSISALNAKHTEMEWELRNFCQIRAEIARRQKEAYREELQARRNFVPEQPGVKAKNPMPAAQWAVWRAHLDKITAHRDYSHKPRNWANRNLLMRLAHFTSEMLAILNCQTWNSRNSAPHLP